MHVTLPSREALGSHAACHTFQLAAVSATACLRRHHSPLNVHAFTPQPSHDITIGISICFRE